MIDEYAVCKLCRHDVAMVLNDPLSTFTLACKCETVSFPITDYWIGDLPPNNDLPDQWDLRGPDGTAKSTTGYRPIH